MDRLIPLFTLYPLWVKILLIVFVFCILILLLFFQKKVSAKDFSVIPINERGENIFKEDKSTKNEFFVITHFNFTTSHKLQIVNIDLSYDLEKATPITQTIVFDNNSEETIDATYRMKHRKHVEKNGIVNIFISRRFICDPVFMEDYQKLKINFELVSPDWLGIKYLQVNAVLKPRGALEIDSMNFVKS